MQGGGTAARRASGGHTGAATEWGSWMSIRQQSRKTEMANRAALKPMAL
jgi:hypothetical protein